MKNIRLAWYSLMFLALVLMITNQAMAKDCTEKGNKVVDGRPVCTPQCVDYIRCKLNIDKRGNASDWWDKPPSGYKKKANGDTKSEPDKKDILVWSKASIKPFGHVAIVDKVDEKNKTITISETNWDYKCNHNTRKLSYKNDKKGKCTVYGAGTNGLLGWLTK